jgi:hypothetical protein
MFSRNSRYRNLPDIVTIDARGQSAESKSLRLLPEVTGTFLHTLQEGERLDHLAYKYYRQPSQWWRICDAEPDIASPRELVGNEPVVSYRFPLGTGNSSDRPPWSDLLRRVGDLVGVEDVVVEEEPAPPAVVDETAEGDPVYETRFERALIVRFNRLSVTLEEVSERIETVVAPAAPPAQLGRVGKQITIPPRAARRGS